MDAEALDGEREKLVDAAVELSGQQGYHRTTVEQIAAAAGVTPQDFARHFATKDALILSITEELMHGTAAALVHVEADTDPAEALLVATTKNLAAIIHGHGVMPLGRMLEMARIVTANDRLQKQASVLRKRLLTRALAEKLGVAQDDRRVSRAVTLWSATAATSYFDHIDMPTRPRDLRHGEQLSQQAAARLVQTYMKVTGHEPSAPR